MAAFETLLETDDKSYFTDELEKLTGRPRRYWAGLPLFFLQKRLTQEMRLWRMAQAPPASQDKEKNS